MPAFRLPQGIAIYFAGWKKHYSLYPATRPVVQELKAELMTYEIGKGTIRFPLSNPVPGRLIAQIAKLRAKELTTKVALTKPGPKRGNRGADSSRGRLPFTDVPVSLDRSTGAGPHAPPIRHRAGET